LRFEQVRKTDAGYYSCGSEFHEWSNLTLSVFSQETDQYQSDGAGMANLERKSLLTPSATILDNDLKEGPPRILSAPRDEPYPHTVVREVGEPYRLRCDAVGQPTPSISWLKDGADYRDNSYKSTIVFKQLLSTDAGTYVCNVCNVHGCVNSTTVLEVAESGELEPSYIQHNTMESHSQLQGEVRLAGPTQDTVMVRAMGRYYPVAAELPRTLPHQQPDEVDVEDEDEDDEGDEAGPTNGTGAHGSDTTEDSAGAVNGSGTPPPDRFPEFTKKEHMPKIVSKPSGNMVRLRCPADGYPKPNITWTKDGREIERTMGQVKKVNWAIVLEDLVPQDSGSYTCTVCNRVGCVSFTTKLEVKDRFPARPHFTERPKNVTALVNTTAIFRCPTLSDLEPHIEWVKLRIVDLENVSIPENVTKLERDPDNPEVLTLENVTHVDEGWYTCIAANSLGASYESAYLQVLDELPPDDTPTAHPVRTHSTLIMGMTIFLCACFTILAVIVIVVCKKLKREKMKHRAMEHVNQWTKKVIVLKQPVVESSIPGMSEALVRFALKPTYPTIALTYEIVQHLDRLVSITSNEEYLDLGLPQLETPPSSDESNEDEDEEDCDDQVGTDHEQLFAKYTCTNCQEDISGIRVHCVVCTDFELCLACFAAGAEIGPHRNDHSYQFMDSGILSIFRGKSGWSAREELHLLDAIEQYGFGNWEDISKHIETRTPEEAKEEYVSKFLNGTIGRHTWQTAVDQRPILTDHTSDDTGPLSQLLIQKLPPMDCTAEEAAALGYMPNRDDFEREYDPTAEQLVSTLSLQPDDEDVDMLLKLAQVDIYTRRLRERARRKRVVRDYQLIANFFRGNMKRARQTRDQREFRERLRTYSQFYTSLEFERLISSLERERALRIRLSELNRYRWNGIQRVDECVHFEQHVAAAQYRNTGPYGHGRTDNRSRGGSGESARGASSVSGSGMAQTLGAGQTTATQGGSGRRSEDVRSSSSTDRKPTHLTDDRGCSDDSYNSKSCLDSSQREAVTNSGGQHQPTIVQRQPHHHHHQAAGGVGSLASDPAQQPGGQLLTSNEIQLCSTLNMPVTRYLTLKTVLLSRPALDHNINSVAESIVKKYLVGRGWLQTSPQN
uniref:receptor protein-tyrosine kinase n=1 Tax=Anopheles christyi TaxID=43041 RepID=A0A182JNW8_9DIPT